MYIGKDRQIPNTEVGQDKRIATCSPHMDQISDLILRLFTVEGACVHMPVGMLYSIL